MTHRTLNGPVPIAMLCSGVVTAQFIAGKATRDALYLAHLDVTTLPAMIVATSAASLLFVAASSKALTRLTPRTFVALAFVLNAGLLTIAWPLAYTVPGAAAVLVYLQTSGFGPMLGSGFWLIASERFDPRSAKGQFGRIAGVGTLGGLAGGLMAERAAAGLGLLPMLPILAALNLACGWLVSRLASRTAAGHVRSRDIATELSSEAPRSGLRVLAEVRYLRNLAAVVLLGTAAAALMDYVFKVHAVATFGQGDELLRFFAVYYAAVSLVTFAVQTSASRVVLEKLGLAVSTGTPSMALLAGSAAALVAPGAATVIAARGGESVLRGSLFRSSYEIFYTPVPIREKRAAKSLIDVGFDRLGDALGGGAIRMVLMLAPTYQNPTLLLLAAGCSGVALFCTSRLNRGYIRTLEQSLINRAFELDLANVQDSTTRTVVLHTSPGLDVATQWRRDAARVPAEPYSAAASSTTLDRLDPELRRIAALRSRDRERILQVLHEEHRLTPSLVPHVIPLLAWDPVATAALNALRRVADERVGALVDALLDPNNDFAIRRRLARVFASCRSQRAADGVILGLKDGRFEVRFQSARSLAALAEANPHIQINRAFILDVVQRETAVGRPVWESNRLLNQREERDEEFFVDEFVKDRASRSLAHVFTLLSLVLPAEPLRIAFRGLHTDDPILRGTALEYLEGVLPPAIRGQLWPFLDDSRPATSRTSRPREDILADLLRSHASIVFNLEKRHQNTPSSSTEPWSTT